MMMYPISYKSIHSSSSIFHKDRIITQYKQNFSCKTANDSHVKTDFKDKYRNKLQIMNQISTLNPVGSMCEKSQRLNFCTTSGTSVGKNTDKKKNTNDKHNGALQQPAGPLYGNGITYDDDESLLEGDRTTLVKPTSSRYFIPQVQLSSIDGRSRKRVLV